MTPHASSLVTSSLMTKSLAALAIASLSLALTACNIGGDDAGEEETAIAAGQGEDSGDEDGEDGAADEGDSPTEGVCPEVPQEGYELFSDPRVSNAPESGAVYGDGTPISWTFEAPEEGTLDVEMSYINVDGDAIPMLGIFLEDYGNNEWGSDLNVFTSDADGRPGFMTLGVTYDAVVADDGSATATHDILGVYCVTFAVPE